MSKKVKIKFSKQIVEIEVNGIVDLKNKIYQIFRIPANKVRIINNKPKIQNDADIKQGIQINIMGTPEDKIIKEDPETKFLNTLSQQQKKYYYLKKQGITQHSFKYDEEIGEVSYITSSLHLLRIIPQFRKFLSNPDLQKESLKLYAEDLNEVYSEIEDQKNDVTKISSIDIVSSFVSYADQVGQFPYIIHDPIWFFHYTFKMLEDGNQVIKYLNPNQNEQSNWISQHFLLKYQTLNDDIDKPKEIQDQQLKKNYNQTLNRWWVVAKIDSKLINDQKNAINYYKGKKMREQKIVYALQTTIERQILNITQLPPFILVYMDRMVHKPNPKKLTDVHINEELNKQYIKQFTHKVTYYKTIDFYDECCPKIQDKLLQGRNKRDQQFKVIKQSKQFKLWVEKSENIKQLSEIQRLYAYKQSTMDETAYKKFYDQQYKQQGGYKNRTGQYNLIGVLTHKGEKHKQSECTAYVQKSKNKWLTFNNNNIQVKTLNNVLSFHGNQQGNKNIELAHILLYRCIQWP